MIDQYDLQIFHRPCNCVALVQYYPSAFSIVFGKCFQQLFVGIFAPRLFDLTLNSFIPLCPLSLDTIYTSFGGFIC